MLQRCVGVEGILQRLVSIRSHLLNTCLIPLALMRYNSTMHRGCTSQRIIASPKTIARVLNGESKRLTLAVTIRCGVVGHKSQTPATLAWLHNIDPMKHNIVFNIIPALEVGILQLTAAYIKRYILIHHNLTQRCWEHKAQLVAIIVADYALATLVIQHNDWSDNVILKLIGGLMIASSTLANFILIYQKIDAWIWWVVYALAGMIFYALIGNAFSFVLFTVFLLVNGAAGIAWIKASKAQK